MNYEPTLKDEMLERSNKTTSTSRRPSYVVHISLVTVVILGIYFSSHFAYVLFHGLVEIVSVAIAFAIFTLVWNTRTYLTNNYLHLLGIGYAFSALIDLFHTFAFKGMTVFTGYGENLAPQLWLAARYLQAVTLVAAPLVMKHKMDNRVVFAAYTAVTAVLMTTIYSGYFPDCIIEGEGLTPFKKGSEYIISAFLIVSLYLLFRRRSHFTNRIFWLLVASVSCTIVSELSFTAFVSMYDFTNKLGHVAKLVAFYLVYRSILVTGLQEPFDLIFRELTTAKERAEFANQAKNTFLASMSHELRTPLNAILGYTQILCHETNITDKQRQQLGIMRASGEHLLTLINEILDLGKIEAQQMELAKSPFYLPELLQQVLEITRFKADEKRLATYYEADVLPDYVCGDERKLRQVLLNLLNNAVKYTPRGGVTLRARYDPTDGGWLQCEIADTGIGIPANKLEAIFEPFTQLARDSQGREGAGLGLTITRRLVALMGGRLNVESRIGQGSMFRFSLPLPPGTAARREAKSQVDIIRGYRGPRKRILVVDDNAANAGLLVAMLEPLGFEIDMAVSGRETLQKTSEQDIDLVLLDLVMPDMDGLETAQTLRQSDRLSNLRIVGVSATITDSEHLRSFVTACDAFLCKPVRIAELMQTVARLLRLEWVLASSQGAGISGEAASPTEVAIPPREVLEALRQAVERGEYDELERLIAVQVAHPAFLAFCEHIRRLAASYDDEGISAYLEQVDRAKQETAHGTPEHNSRSG